MAYLNENYLKLQAGYLFPEVARRVRKFCESNPVAAEHRKVQELEANAEFASKSKLKRLPRAYRR